jgi:hypothetical protein
LHSEWLVSQGKWGLSSSEVPFCLVSLGLRDLSLQASAVTLGKHILRKPEDCQTQLKISTSQAVLRLHSTRYELTPGEIKTTLKTQNYRKAMNSRLLENSQSAKAEDAPMRPVLLSLTIMPKKQ